MSTRQNRKISLIFVLVITLIAFACVRPTASATTYVPGDDDTATLASPPVISNVSVTRYVEGNAIISWDTDEPATSHVEYGKTSACNLSSELDETLVLQHDVMIEHLEYDTIYFLGLNQEMPQVKRRYRKTTPSALRATTR